MLDKVDFRPDILIHVGEVSGDYSSLSLSSNSVWRVSVDGEIRDTFSKLSYVFEMKEVDFFNIYSVGKPGDDSYLNACKECLSRLREGIPDMPFSNIWAASQLASRIPEKSTIHFAILNSLRAWNYFEIPPSVESHSNVGGFGIDGCLSSLIGASLANPNKLYFCVIGDLAFFYDMNVLGNRHIGNNLRILIVNNGTGNEFKQYNHHAAYFGESADEFIAAAGHFGNKSSILVRHYSQALGFDYLTASNKAEFLDVYEKFIEGKNREKICCIRNFY
ncbi:MAG: thiamine pyrophosphate-dependent enzyme [Cellvibrionaceae bacterium]|nr:thiamine pyrophosphate-dependent enzyme [Cellvibrionaceae bacterium]